MEYQHKSGASKRKEKRERDEKANRGQQKLLGFFSQPKNSSFIKTKNENEPITLPTSLSSQELDAVSNDDLADGASSMNREEPIVTTVVKLHDIEYENEMPSTSKNLDFQPESIFDVGNLNDLQLNAKDVESAVINGPGTHPKEFPTDSTGRQFRLSLLKFKLPNSEAVTRDWIVWSNVKQALFCFPCRLFCTQPEMVRSKFASVTGYSVDQKWKKLYDRIPEHQNSHSHKECYMKWKDMEISVKKGGTLFQSIKKQVQSEITTWKQILKRLLDVTLFLSERGLPFRGDSQKVGDPNNGNFLGVLELLSHYDPVLSKHLEQVQHSQEANKRMQVHYLSWQTQNEFITCCANYVRKIIVDELKTSKYYSLMVDATPDSSHIEQTSFVFRYIALNENLKKYEIHERFLEFSDCNEKTGEEIANNIKEVLKKHDISLDDCRGQGFDNGSNMSGKYKGVQAIILKSNPLAIFSPCGCHSLNLCGVCAAECCTEAQTFFGVVQNMYNLFSCSPKRWEILKAKVGSSLHSLSDTRWSARVECVKPIAAHIGKIREAVLSLLELNIPVETKSMINGILEYINTFKCVIMASIWVKLLTPINYRSKLLQAMDATVDLEADTIESLIREVSLLRDSWDQIISESKLVASAYNIETEFPTHRTKKRKTFHGETADEMSYKSPEERFKIEVFYTIVDVLISNLKNRFAALKLIQGKFSFLWKNQEMDDVSIEEACTSFHKEYKTDVSPDLIDEIKYLKSVKSNISETPIKPLDLLNKLIALNVTNLFPNVCIALRIFCCLPVSVAQAERSFSVLDRIKNCLRSTMGQQRLTDLGVLAIESKLARTLDFDTIIQSFAERKARKAML